jgi:hypothetical protein
VWKLSKSRGARGSELLDRDAMSGSIGGIEVNQELRVDCTASDHLFMIAAYAMSIDTLEHV